MLDWYSLLMAAPLKVEKSTAVGNGMSGNSLKHFAHYIEKTCKSFDFLDNMVLRSAHSKSKS